MKRSEERVRQLCLKGTGSGTVGTWVGGILSVGHLSNIDTRSARHVVGGGVAGAEPPHKGGPNRPDRTTAVVSG